MTRTQDIHRLEDDFAEAMQRLYSVGNALARLRAELDREAAAPTVAPAPAGTAGAAALSAASGATAGPLPSAGVPPMPTLPRTPPAASPSAPSALRGPSAAVPAPGPLPRLAPDTGREPVLRWWQREGAVIITLVIAGAVVTLAGVVMLLALAIEHGWLGPVARVTGGALLAAALVGGGLVRRRRELDSEHPTAGPVAMTATGCAAAYLDIVAATTVYDLVPDALGLALAALVAASGLALAWRWGSQLLSVITVLGAALLAPTVAPGSSTLVAAFLVVLTAAATPVQVRHRWPVLQAAATLPVSLYLVVQVSAMATHGTIEHAVAIGLSGAVAALAVAAAVLGTRSEPAADPMSLSDAEAVGSTFVLVGAVPVVGAVWYLAAPGRTVGLLMVAAAYLVLTVLGGRGRIAAMGAGLRATLGAVGTATALIAVGTGAPDHHVATGLIPLAAAYLAVAAATRSRLALGLGAAASVPALLAYLPRVAAIAGPARAAEVGPGAMLLDSLLAAGLLALLGWIVAARRLVPASARPLVVAVLWTGGLAVTATTAVSVGMLVGQAVGREQAGFVGGHALATVAWMAAAAWLLARGLTRVRDAGLALRVGLVLAGIGVAKLFLFDLVALDSLWRAAAFLVTGVLLLLAGASYAQALERTRVPAHPAG